MSLIDHISVPVASISIVEVAAHGPLLQMMGNRAYLKDLLCRRGGT